MLVWMRMTKSLLYPRKTKLEPLRSRFIETWKPWFRTITTPSRGYPSVLQLVYSSINLALPSGPFDEPAVAHRASCNAGSIPPEEEERLLPMFLHPTSPSSPIGFLRPDVVEEILKDHLECGMNSIWSVLRRPDDVPWAVCFGSHITHSDTRTEAMRSVLQRLKCKGLFNDVLKGWSNETYPVYTPLRERSESTSNVAFGIERAALPLFGFPNFGCLLTAFYDCPVTNRTMLWISRRSPKKSTWPGQYDCTVGGGIGLGETPKETIIREGTEEASLPSDFVRKHARSTGVLNFTNRSPSKWILPGIYYLYDLRLPTDGTIVPYTNAEDGEVDAFQLMDIGQVMRLLLQDHFKPSSAMALVDFFIRRGIITPDSNSQYLELCMAMRRPVVLPLP